MRRLKKIGVLILVFIVASAIYSLEIGKVEVLKGNCEVLRSSAGEWEKVEKESLIFVNDQVRTYPDTSAKFVYAEDKTLLALKDDSQITFQEYSLVIERGALMIQVQKKGSKFEVKTPTAVAGIRGTLFEMSVMPDGATECFVYNGLVYLSDPTDRETGSEVGPGNKCSVRRNKKGIKNFVVEKFSVDKRMKKYSDIVKTAHSEVKETGMKMPSFGMPVINKPIISEEPELVQNEEEPVIEETEEEIEEEIAESYVKGDLDGDGKITGEDIKRIKRFLKKMDFQKSKIRDGDAEIFKKCDMNNDSKVDNVDFLILRALARNSDGTLMVKDKSGEELRKMYRPNFGGTDSSEE